MVLFGVPFGSFLGSPPPPFWGPHGSPPRGHPPPFRRPMGPPYGAVVGGGRKRGSETPQPRNPTAPKPHSRPTSPLSVGRGGEIWGFGFPSVLCGVGCIGCGVGLWGGVGLWVGWGCGWDGGVGWNGAVGCWGWGCGGGGRCGWGWGCGMKSELPSPPPTPHHRGAPAAPRRLSPPPGPGGVVGGSRRTTPGRWSGVPPEPPALLQRCSEPNRRPKPSPGAPRPPPGSPPSHIATAAAPLWGQRGTPVRSGGRPGWWGDGGPKGGGGLRASSWGGG